MVSETVPPGEADQLKEDKEMKEKEIVWVDKEFAERLKKLESEESTREQQDRVFDEYLAKISDYVKRDFAASLEGLEEDAAIFTGLMLKVKQAFEKAKDEQLTASYALWEKFEEEKPSISKKIAGLAETLNPLIDQLTTVNSLLDKLNTYNIDRVVESVSLLNGLYGGGKDMMEFLITNFKAK